MKRPTSVVVLGKTFKIEYVALPVGTQGECDQKTQTIRVDPTYHVEQRQDTMLHEILHAIDDQMNLKCGERRVHNLALAILEVMNANPDIRKFIFGL